MKDGCHKLLVIREHSNCFNAANFTNSESKSFVVPSEKRPVATVAWWSVSQSCNPEVAGSRPCCVRMGIRCKKNDQIFNVSFLTVETPAEGSS